MYDILGKFNNLTPVEKTVVETKTTPIYESVAAKGSIVAGVKDVEKKLREQYESMEEERETLKTKTGTIYKGGKYGTEYQGDPDDEDKPKRGRPAAGTAKKEKVVKVKGPKGRPKKDKPAEYSKSNDPFGRVPDKAPKGKKGTVIKGKATIDTNEAAKNPYAIGMAQAKKEIGLGKAKVKGLPKSTIKRAHHIGDTIKANESRQQQLTNMLLEGVNFTEMIKKKDITLQEMLAELQADIQTFKETGHCSELLRDCMEVHSFNKQQLNDAVMDESPVFSLAAHKNKEQNKLQQPAGPGLLDRAKEFGGQVLNKLGHGSDEELKADLRRKMGMNEADQLDELARLAGLTIESKETCPTCHSNPCKCDDMEEGNLFTKGLEDDNVKVGEKIPGTNAIKTKDINEMWGNPYDDDKVDAINKANPPKSTKPVSNPAIPVKHHTYDRKAVSSHISGSDSAAYDYRGMTEDADEDRYDKVLQACAAIYEKQFGGGDEIWDSDWMGDWANSIEQANPTDQELDFIIANGRMPKRLAHVEFNQGDDFQFGEAYVRSPSNIHDPYGDEASPEEHKAYQDELNLYKTPGAHPALASMGMHRAQSVHDRLKQVLAKKQTGMAEDDMEEGNLFTKGLEDDDIKVGEKIPGTNAIKTKDIDESDVMEDIRRLAGLKECGEMSPIGSMAQDMQKQQGRMSVNTSADSEGHKTVTITADGEEAEKLSELLKLAGMAMGSQPQEHHAEIVVAAQPMEARDYGDTEVEDAPEYINSPRERVKGMHSAETTGFADQTDDLNKQKDQDPETANKAANPKTKEMPKLESVDPLESLGAKLMAEYNSIKIAK